jgi:CDGSH-type Zn-finger protein
MKQTGGKSFMSRIIKKEGKAPYALKEEDSKYICMCGLSANQPFCNGAHTKTNGEEEGKLYNYESGEREEISIVKK